MIPEQNENRMYGLLLAMGVSVHLLYLALLLHLMPLDQWNWAHCDTSSYQGPAQAFLQTGVFARLGVPDFTRTIGYPLFLAGAMDVAGRMSMDWRKVVYVLQAILFAFSYPAIYFLGRIVFGLTRRAAIGCVAFTLISGAFISYVPIILSDALFATALLVGTVCGFQALRQRSLAWGLAHIATVTYAMNVRPILGLYPFAVAAVHGAYIWSQGWSLDRSRRLLVVALGLGTLIGVQAPALRNWVHHGAFTPSENVSINLYDCLARDVLASKRQLQCYEPVHAQLTGWADHGLLKERIRLRTREALTVFRQYPVETAAFAVYYATMNTMEMHWNNTLFYLLRQTWHRDYADGSVQERPEPFILGLAFVVVYGYLYLAGAVYVVGRRKHPWVMVAGVLFAAPAAFCAITYQGARLRLWIEPFIVLAAAATLQQALAAWARHRQAGTTDRPLEDLGSGGGA
jgi:hypothetical protein